jgi:hypothetical protein
MILFSGPPGRVVAMKDPGVAGVLPAALVTPNPVIKFASQKAIITRLMIAQSSSYQFLHTLGGDLYIYVFGERVGNLTLSGMSFAVDCTSGDASGDDGVHGIEKMITWYKTNRLSTRSDPVTILVGKQTTLTAFVADFNADVVDQKSFLVAWTLDLMLVPDK